MRIFSNSTLKQFYELHLDSQAALRAWRAEVSAVTWQIPADIKAHYRNVSFVADKVVFNICGNKYRLIVKINYDFGAVFIKFIGTHEQYNKINVKEL